VKEQGRRRNIGSGSGRLGLAKIVSAFSMSQNQLGKNKRDEREYTKIVYHRLIQQTVS
jgi:hypothetical protein